MKVKINDQLICIPPFISARWNQIAFIESEEEETKGLATLKLHLVSGKTTVIPNLDQSIIDIAFHEHLRHLETSQTLKDDMPRDDDKVGTLVNIIQQISKNADITLFSPKHLASPLFSGSNPIEMILQHAPEHKDHPDAPADVLEKMAAIIRTLTGNNPILLPKPEPHCNCIHCQIGKVILEEENMTVTDQDLSFRTWDIVQTGDKLYVVSNPLDPQEQFSVYLGSPIGCTCGEMHCEHVKAVLYT
ncbi:hypothetical protein CP10139811_0269 [Chlamydia ibidis]|uniref:SWIM-type domain-containing protein n=2 Tax=Chlamydia ibidis TaxID=1405396 RepID=S7J472_9CHLA|nr:hypothetical protein [Chlamydia ibidis]EPP35033.1 hypothetical protein CP10139811_0269 [Chlamydia ibidis]EQM62698.1 hypothetical protein H359_0716 [Chlamydia ibidis 10-1398/6]